MFRHILKLGLGASAKRNLIYGNQRLVLSRHFSNELTADWPEAIKSFLEKERITKPTLIQEKTLPAALKNKDIVGVARTGSGKTLAFVIPAVMKILAERETSNDPKKPRCLVMAPTRELAAQTADVFKKFGGMNIKSLVLVGGSSRSAQLYSLEDGDHDVYIATPGRLLDLVDDGRVDLSHIKYLVLDEADRMLDMGFEPQIRRIVSRLPKDRQTMMWSATWPREIQDLAAEFMNDYEQIAVDSAKLKANPNIRQIVKVCAPFERFNTVVNYLNECKQNEETPRVLIFVNTKRMADSLMMQLMKHRYRAISMHGDRSQRQRDDALRLFKNRQCNIMIATDVAARGLDISDISHVINYDLPNNIEDYIHRIGRTARHDKEGCSFSIATENDAGIAQKLIGVLTETNQEVPEELEEISRSSGGIKSRGYGGRGYGGRGYGGRGNADRGYGDRGYGNRGYGDRRHGDRGYGEREYGDQEYGDREYGDREYRDREYGDRGGDGSFQKRRPARRMMGMNDDDY